MNVTIKRLNDDAVIPTYGTAGAAGFDLSAATEFMVYPGQTVKVPTGLAFAIPEGYELQIRPRSGITSKTKLRVQIGTVDSDYRGEVSIIVDNIGNRSKRIQKGDRIAQGVIAPIVQAVFVAGELDQTERGSNGFGSTGINTELAALINEVMS